MKIQTEKELRDFINSLCVPTNATYATFQKHGKKFYSVEFWKDEPQWDSNIKEFDCESGIIDYEILYNADAVKEEFQNCADTIQVLNQNLYKFKLSL